MSNKKYQDVFASDVKTSSRDEIIAELLSDRHEIYANRAILETAHMRTNNKGIYEQNDVLFERFRKIMADWQLRQPMLQRA